MPTELSEEETTKQMRAREEKVGTRWKRGQAKGGLDRGPQRAAAGAQHHGSGGGWVHIEKRGEAPERGLRESRSQTTGSEPNEKHRKT